MGEQASESASKGWIPAYNRLLKFEGGVFQFDRSEHLLTLYRTDTEAGKRALRKSLEDFAPKARTPGLQPDLKFIDVEKLYSTGYRYTSEIDWLQERGWSYPAHNKEGWYCSFDDFIDSTTARDRLQLPLSNTAKYKVEFDITQVKDSVYIPYGRQSRAPWFEALADDYPDLGGGGGSQYLVKHSGFTIKKVSNITTNPPTVIFTRP